jgi:hypothetical protein
MYEIKKELSRFSTIEVFKVGDRILTILLTGTGLDSMDVYNRITDIFMGELVKTYPYVEVMKNENNYFLLVLKK